MMHPVSAKTPAKTRTPSVMTLGEALMRAEEKLKSSGVPGPEREAQLMAAELMGLRPAEVYLKRDLEVKGERLRTLDEWVERRCGREPSQYITGSTGFRGLEIKVNSEVLIPRPETEQLAGEAIGGLEGLKAASPLVLDLCTGSGCIAVSIATEVKGARIFAVDLSPGALKVARENAAAHGVSGRVEFLEGDLFAPLKGLELGGSFDLIVSNPPYVAGEELKKVQPEVRLFEPYIALYGGEDGLDFIRRIVADAPDYLKPGGVLMLEIGYGQSGDVKSIIEGTGRYEACQVKKDFSGIDRIVRARRRGGR